MGVHVGDKIEHLDATESLLDVLEVVVGRKSIEVGLGDNRQKHLASDSRERVGSLRHPVSGSKPAALGGVSRDDVADALGDCGFDLVEDGPGCGAETVKALGVGGVEDVVDDVRKDGMECSMTPRMAVMVMVWSDWRLKWMALVFWSVCARKVDITHIARTERNVVLSAVEAGRGRGSCKDRRVSDSS